MTSRRYIILGPPRRRTKKEKILVYRFDNSRLVLCLHELKNSCLLFKVPNSGLCIIKYFSFKQSLQQLLLGLKGLPLASIFHFPIVYPTSASFNSQMCLLRQVLVLWFLCLKLAVWLLNLSFHSVAESPR